MIYSIVICSLVWSCLIKPCLTPKIWEPLSFNALTICPCTIPWYRFKVPWSICAEFTIGIRLRIAWLYSSFPFSWSLTCTTLVVYTKLIYHSCHCIYCFIIQTTWEIRVRMICLSGWIVLMLTTRFIVCVFNLSAPVAFLSCSGPMAFLFMYLMYLYMYYLVLMFSSHISLSPCLFLQYGYFLNVF